MNWLRRGAIVVVGVLGLAGVLVATWGYWQFDSLERKEQTLQTRLSAVERERASAQESNKQLRSQVSTVQSLLATTQSQLAQAQAKAQQVAASNAAPALGAPSYSCQNDPVVWANTTQVLAETAGRSPNQALINDLCAYGMTSTAAMHLYLGSLSENDLAQKYGIR